MGNICIFIMISDIINTHFPDPAKSTKPHCVLLTASDDVVVHLSFIRHQRWCQTLIRKRHIPNFLGRTHMGASFSVGAMRQDDFVS